MKFKEKSFLIIVLILTVFLVSCTEKTEASESLSLIVNNKDITSRAMPIVKNNRTLVPVRFVSEELGAKVTWNNSNRTVLIEKEDINVLLKIDSRLINYNEGQDYGLSDVETQLLNKDKDGNLRTYVPLRLISNALDIGVEWNEGENNVYIDSNKEINKESISSVKIISQKEKEKITGKTSLQVETEREYPESSNIEFLLLDKGETSGFIIEKGKDISGKYDFIPKIEDNGEKILVARILDENGMYLDGHAVPINIEVEAKVDLLGINYGDTIDTTADLSVKTNFLPLYVKYEIEKISPNGQGKKILTDTKDPLSIFTWNPMMKDNGVHSIRAIAYDGKDNPYYSQPIIVQVDKERVLSLSGVKNDMLVDKEVNLLANRNFDVSETEYFIRDINTGKVSSLAKMPYGGYKWNPGPKDSGEKELFVKVVEKGKTYESKPIRVSVDGKAKLFLEGIGPGQVVNKDTELSINSNVDVDNIEYIVTNPRTNKKRKIIPEGKDNKAIYNLLEWEKDNMLIKAEGIYNGQRISSEEIKFKVYHGEVFGPKSIVEKDEFISLASKLATNTYNDIGMSAALQTAQAILETGWGQSVPVDKYTGTLSNNLFGIKGEGEAGSVVSNTWEVYNGERYRVDANFRAYKTVDGSWKDHKDLLLKSERYKPVIDVMYDYTKGAWALKRAGYATDPDYPIKLINIINKYKLYELDKVKV